MKKCSKRRRHGRLLPLTAEQRTKRQERRERNGKLTGAVKMQRHIVGYRDGEPVYRHWVKPQRRLRSDWFRRASRALSAR